MLHMHLHASDVEHSRYVETCNSTSFSRTSSTTVRPNHHSPTRTLSRKNNNVSHRRVHPNLIRTPYELKLPTPVVRFSCNKTQIPTPIAVPHPRLLGQLTSSLTFPAPELFIVFLPIMTRCSFLSLHISFAYARYGEDHG